MGNSWSTLGRFPVDARQTNERGRYGSASGRPPLHGLDSAVSGCHHFAEMHRARQEDFREDRDADELADAPRAVILIGDAARDHDHVDALLAANAMVILLPSLETMHSVLALRGRRGGDPTPTHRTAAAGNLRLDLTEHRVLLGERQLPVSERELAMLATLSEQPGKARTFAELAAKGGEWFGDVDSVHSAIKRLRRKLARASVEARIESVRGYGFRLVTRSTDPPLGISGGSTSLTDRATASRGVPDANEVSMARRRR